MENEVFRGKGRDAISKIKELLAKGNVNRIVVKNSAGKKLLDVPVNIIAVGALLAPMLSGAGFFLAFLTDCVVEIEKK
ncbi:MAG: hypothetical protein ACI9BD_000801 [Candidatus Marinamargulisbacteria bacterium]|jgi:hypothetical protein